MNKFTLQEGGIFITHNIPPLLTIQIITNDNDEYDKFNDLYDIFSFRGNQFVFLVVEADTDLEHIEDYSLYRSIIKRAFKWYKNQVYIERHEKKRIFEDENYVLQRSEEMNHWVCAAKKEGIVVIFQEGNFNETQKMVYLEDFPEPDVMTIARQQRLIGEWLMLNHSEKL
ncbi:hypothetical protein ACFSTE_10925 [Aquimarina hainanensis]|uniref:Uncharacterized protein n=1 Tax=Aquimarina hainanensis TaxID=1578017 RepID=A0ABW5NAT9_9FLAO